MVPIDLARARREALRAEAARVGQHLDEAEVEQDAGAVRPEGRRYRYYRCSRRDKGGRAACAARAAPAAALEGFVRERLRAFALDGAL
ncbi:MAG TPA: recombinase zinc beta ribbon domain-containing protein, partial [Polyangiaceae bacterium]|nr:recombinase zinc beta ribbon domain-containing protein [Polyangiaceae bacterium]